MTAQLPLLPVTLPEGAEALLVLRDWLEQHTGRTDLDRMSEWRLVAYGRAIGAPAGLVAAALREAEAPVRQRFDPTRLYAELRAKHPRARVGLLATEPIALALERHIEALHLGASWGRELEAVHTTVLGDLDSGSVADDLTLLGPKHCAIQRSGRSTLGERAQIDLPPGWAREHRKRGTRPPWHVLPSGWALSGHGRWAYRPLKEPDPRDDPSYLAPPGDEGGW